MPKRTNTFQQVVRLVHEHLAADGARVEESHLLRDGVTGEDREVDVTLETEVGGYDVVVSIEATSRQRPADVKWVEGEISKHRSLPTNKLVLVSESGFSSSAGRKIEAEQGWVVAITPEELELDPKRTVLARLGVAIAKTMKIWPADETTVLIETPEGEIAQAAPAEDGYDPVVVAPDGTPLGGLAGEIRRRLAKLPADLAERAGVSDEPQRFDAKYRMELHDWSYASAGGSEDAPGCLKWVANDGSSEEDCYTPIVGVVVAGRIEFEVVHVSLTHMKLGPVATAYGNATLDDGDGLIVVTESEPGSVRASLRNANGQLADLTVDGRLLE